MASNADLHNEGDERRAVLRRDRDGNRGEEKRPAALSQSGYRNVSHDFRSVAQQPKEA